MKRNEIYHMDNLLMADLVDQLIYHTELADPRLAMEKNPPNPLYLNLNENCYIYNVKATITAKTKAPSTPALIVLAAPVKESRVDPGTLPVAVPVLPVVPAGDVPVAPSGDVPFTTG